MIESSLRQIGAARSGVIDENGVILAGNGTFDALTAAGINKIKIVEADGQEWVVVRRKGLTAEQKRALAIADNRAAELAEWDGPMLAAQGIDLAPWFTPAELEQLGLASNGVGAETISSEQAHATLRDRFLIPPFSVLDARQGYWQERKRAWIALGIQSELGRGGGVHEYSEAATIKRQGGSLGHDGTKILAQRNRERERAAPGGSLMPAANYSKNQKRGDGKGRPIE